MLYQQPGRHMESRTPGEKSPADDFENEDQGRGIETAYTGLPGAKELVAETPERQVKVEQIESLQPNKARQRLAEKDLTGAETKKMTPAEIDQEISDLVAIIESVIKQGKPGEQILKAENDITFPGEKYLITESSRGEVEKELRNKDYLIEPKSDHLFVAKKGDINIVFETQK